MWLVGVVCSRIFFFFKQKTAYEMRISDWSSDVCSSDLNAGTALPVRNPFEVLPALGFAAVVAVMVLASRWAIERFGDSGLATLLALIGLYDVDSGIITVGNLPSGALSPHMAGLLLMLPVIVNTVLKGVIAIVFAGPSRGVSASLPLMVAAAVAGAGLAVGWLLL